MLAKRIIPCLDVKEGKVVKGVKFRNHRVMGDILELAAYYSISGADELVFYDISASSDNRTVSRRWIEDVARCIDIPFCVAGGIRKADDAELILNSGADKISINSPALENPSLINRLVEQFGSQCVVIGIDSIKAGEEYRVCQYTGDEKKTRRTERLTTEWIEEIQQRGAGEIVLNCMDQDGVRNGYDITQLSIMREKCSLPLIASGGAGQKNHFLELFKTANADAALAATVFHQRQIEIADLKSYLSSHAIEVRK